MQCVFLMIWKVPPEASTIDIANSCFPNLQFYEIIMQRLSFDFPASTVNLAKIGELAAHAGQKAGFSNVNIGDIQVAIDEACTNTIIHGLEKDPTRMFQLIIQWDAGKIEILIHETGVSFDPESIGLPDIEAPLEDRSAGGLGIYLVRKLMDEVKYSTDEDGVKTLYMLKRVK